MTTLRDDQQVNAAERGPAQVVSVRFAPEELARLKEIAESENVPLSAVIRRAVLAPASSSGTMSLGPDSGSRSGLAIVGHFSVFGDSGTSTQGTSGEFNPSYTAGHSFT